MEDTEGQHLPFLTKTMDFGDGTSYELLRPLTNYRVCHDGTPAEARIVFTCRRISSPTPTKINSTAQQNGDRHTSTNHDEEFIMKIKIQVPLPNSTLPYPGPSTTTAAELEALTRFRTANNPYVPHLVTYHATTQPVSGPLPGGYITYLIMTKMPGLDMFGRYWSAYVGRERDEISAAFLVALSSIRELGIEPKDCALRNVLWDANEGEGGGGRCSVIDFELWEPIPEEDGRKRGRELSVEEGKRELQKWGLAYRPVSKDWWAEWSHHMR